MTTEKQYDWYVVRCFSGHEKKVKEYLEREIDLQGMEDKINEILIPTETVIEIRSGKKRTREKNFFPGYLLLKTIYDEEVNNLSSRSSLYNWLFEEREKVQDASIHFARQR
ncbi:MAG: transcription termination/antitermination NusG family protein [Balneolaceae bacterium]|nr:transcription termination/antitermination NusG family protein [Balneolaceae bacterium]